MANFRPAGLSDEDTESDDDYGYFEKLNRNNNYTRNIEIVKQKTETRLQEAVINGDLEEVIKVIHTDLKGNINYRLESGWAPLFHACFHSQEKIVQYLLDKGADPNMHADSVTPVMLACASNSTNESAIYNIVLNLIQKDCLLNIGDKNGLTPLMRAVNNGLTSVVELILDNNVNIEMRDRQGWTAVFCAVHNNKPKCLEILINKGARINIVDMSNRSLQLIAYSYDNSEIKEILSRYIQEDEAEDRKGINDFIDISAWQDYYPGLRDENKPRYKSEIPYLLYGMNCERLKNIFEESSMDLRTFLLLEESDMIKMGIDMPFERQRLRLGLRNFHLRSWKISSVAGLQAQRGNSYSIIECMNVLGCHLQQLYVQETTLSYILRDYAKLQNQIKFEPPDSPVMQRFHSAAKKMIANINNIRREVNNMKKIHYKISKDSLKPVDLITEKTTKEIAVELITELVLLSSLGLLVYHAKGFIVNMFKK